MTLSSWQRRQSAPKPDLADDAFRLGRRLNALRKARGQTLATVSDAVGVAPSQLSMIENGKREAKLSTVQALAEHYGVSLDAVLEGPTSKRTQLEIELEGFMRSPLAASRGLPAIRVGPRTPNDVLEAMVALHREVLRLSEQHIATPEEARRANTILRDQMRDRGNYYGELEAKASELLRALGYRGGPFTSKEATELTRHLGFEIRYVDDLPHSTRSVSDLRNHRIYLAREASSVGHDRRSVLLQALGHHVLGHQPPADYAEFLAQRVETNYLAGAITLPEAGVVKLLRAGAAARDLDIDTIRDAYGVSWETAAHRVTNLATKHLGIPVHFVKVHETGTVYKAYENDGTLFPMDPTGAIEGQPVCRQWASRQIFEKAALDRSFEQYTDTPAGTYWDTVRVERAPGGLYSIALGTDFVNAKYFRGRETRVRRKSTCPDEGCCRRPPADLLSAWGGRVWPSARARTHMLAALPPGAFPGVDETEVYTFLQAHAADG
ncbi:MAG TPA: helix-turn-helix domain-containing protein [Propionibacterium sp.]|nr:helix-turn-helix domain-containing protein [Propionibacterium sp.]